MRKFWFKNKKHIFHIVHIDSIKYLCIYRRLRLNQFEFQMKINHSRALNFRKVLFNNNKSNTISKGGFIWDLDTWPICPLNIVLHLWLIPGLIVVYIIAFLYFAPVTKYHRGHSWRSFQVPDINSINYLTVMRSFVLSMLESFVFNSIPNLTWLALIHINIFIEFNTFILYEREVSTKIQPNNGCWLTVWNCFAFGECVYCTRTLYPFCYNFINDNYTRLFIRNLILINISWFIVVCKNIYCISDSKEQFFFYHLNALYTIIRLYKLVLN